MENENTHTLEQFAGKEGLTGQESRFGDKEKIVSTMLNGELVGEPVSIEKICADIPPHTNKVDIQKIRSENGVNAVEFVTVKGQEGEYLTCVFKPQSGEARDLLKDWDFNSFYPRECAAYLVSDHFGFDVVPPTIIRKINDKVGSLQLFLPHENHSNYERLFSDEEGLKSAIEGRDFKLIAILDWILANCDRNRRNLMYDHESPETLFAIDHGMILNTWSYVRHELSGPSFTMSCESRTEEPKSDDIPSDLIALIRAGYKNRGALTKKLLSDVDGPEGVTEEDIEEMWRRVEVILRTGKFVSKRNFQLVTGHKFPEAVA